MVSMKWQPIDTAPERALVITKHGEIYDGYRGNDGRWCASDPRGGGDYLLNEEPTHWMPLPEPPDDNKL